LSSLDSEYDRLKIENIVQDESIAKDTILIIEIDGMYNPLSVGEINFDTAISVISDTATVPATAADPNAATADAAAGGTEVVDETPLEENGSSVCGCEEYGVKFCNYDYGDTGFCEECNSYNTYQDCSETGLPEAGINDCVLNCFGPDAIATAEE
jgi:hypothetical protein